MSERPTLTIAVPCPTCGGTNVVRYHHESGKPYGVDHYYRQFSGTEPCPDCTDGTIRQAVSCAGCKWSTAIADDEIECALLLMKNSPDWGCLSWEAKA